MICPYCNNNANLVTGEEVYPHRNDLYDKYFWLCKNCNAYVGCHPGSTNPLGRLANAELRKFKSAVHRVFDPIWKSKKKKRKEAYKWLSEKLNITFSECHIGMFDVDTCKKAIKVCNELQS